MALGRFYVDFLTPGPRNILIFVVIILTYNYIIAENEPKYGLKSAKIE